ncbi:7,8 dihydro-8-oxoguanine DNA glycosylase, putative [Theileria annulata]|uniref:DNA-(apurinic or apyrimidinic site) lyase n=1 Tax=Theileria annulata TaxID=5874 RepID=Q4UIG2_THEAN|nr:7,8 dihydro-8-oxoguanine DNA glycosylase, putative [Theileria annulata]CAI73127.1 7,8 dihydro-8-oxoguanine DNA glycosylase, putative [Theileria annulata]|eukprot:XP_953805.1 7,8 dihydro-8-oxoguanine DNA glycosylase, putative [Theileria annulata]
MCSDPGPSTKWFDLRVPLTVLRPELLLTTGQSFTWKCVGNKHWVGVLGSSVYEIKQSDDTTLYRTLFGKCSRERLWDYFDLDNEYSVDFTKAPKPVKQIIKRRSGVRILQQDPFECLISFICSSNNNISRITRMLNEIKRNFGTFLAKSEVNNETFDFYAFPSVDQLRKATPEQLKKLGLGYRSDFIFKTVEILNSRGLNWLYSLRNEDSDTCKSALTSLPGVGRKVADCVSLFSLGKRDVVPVDVHIQKIANTFFGVKCGKSLSDSDYERIGTAFRNFAGDNAGWAQAVLFIDSVIKS